MRSSHCGTAPAGTRRWLIGRAMRNGEIKGTCEVKYLKRAAEMDFLVANRRDDGWEDK